MSDRNTTTPDNAGERRENAALIQALTGEDYVTTNESAAVLEWCREWARDAFEGIHENELTDADFVLRRCNRLIDGGLVFVLADVRRCDRAAVLADAAPREAARDAKTIEDARTDATLAGDDTAGTPEHNRAIDWMARVDDTNDGEFGMFTPEGNAHVAAIVASVLALPGTADYRHDVAVGCLDELADMPGMDEAFDTAVRDSVWAAIHADMDATEDTAKPTASERIRAARENAEHSGTDSRTEDACPTVTDAEMGAYSVQRQHSGTEDGSFYYVLRADGSRADGAGHVYEESARCDAAEMAREDTAAIRHEDAASVTALAAIDALVQNMHEICGPSTDAQAVYSAHRDKLAAMLTALPASVLVDVPDDTLALVDADGSLYALAAVLRALAADPAVGIVPTLTAADGARVLEWARAAVGDMRPDFADMDAATVLELAARHGDGMAALVREALALPRAIAAANAHATLRPDWHVRANLNERERFAVAAKIARDAMPGMLALADVAGTVHSSVTIREWARDAADVLADMDALTAAGFVHELNADALAALAAILNEGLASVDVNAHELVNATLTSWTVRKLADGTRGRGDAWGTVGSALMGAGRAADGIARQCRADMRHNESLYYSGDGADMSAADSRPWGDR